MTRVIKLLSFALCLLFSNLFAVKSGGKQHASIKFLNQQPADISVPQQASAASRTADVKEEKKDDAKVEVKDQPQNDIQIDDKKEQPVLGWGAWLYSFIASSTKK